VIEQLFGAFISWHTCTLKSRRRIASPEIRTKRMSIFKLQLSFPLCANNGYWPKSVLLKSSYLILPAAGCILLGRRVLLSHAVELCLLLVT
jgi:hypothetical protein